MLMKLTPGLVKVRKRREIKIFSLILNNKNIIFVYFCFSGRIIHYEFSLYYHSCCVNCQLYVEQKLRKYFLVLVPS